jgi:transcription-repair coupling factor (superfamily II helicase)
MNLSGILNLLNELPAYRQVLANLEHGANLRPFLLPKSARPPLLAHLFLQQKKPILLLTGRVDAVSAWTQALEAWLPPGSRPLRFPEPTPLPYERGPWSDRSRLGRLQVLCRFVAGRHPLMPHSETPPLVVTSARALLQKTLPQRQFLAATRVWRVGQSIDLEKTLAEWQGAGYESVSVVEAPGHFSRRGGILDIYPAASPLPVRVELFGDEIDSLRHFNPATQRSTDLPATIPTTIESVIVTPAREAMPGELRPLGEALQAAAPAKESEFHSWLDDLPDLVAGTLSPHLEYYLPMLYPQPANLLDYLPEETLLVIDDAQELAAAVQELHNHAEQIAAEQPNLPPGYPSPLFAPEDLEAQLAERPKLVLGEGPSDGEFRPEEQPEPELAYAFQPGPRYGGQVRPLINQLHFVRQAGERTVIVSRQAQRLAELWREESGEPARPVTTLPQLPDAGQIAFVQGSLVEGFVLQRENGATTASPELLLHLLTDAEIFGWNRPAPSRRRAPRPIAPETYFADIAAGNFIVHLEFGIGQFMGLVVRSVGGTEREYLQVRYANGDVLYVPVHHADRLSKWIGSEERPPTMHRLGDKGWKAARAKAQQAAGELADELLDLYAAREMVAGHAFSADHEWLTELEASFPYQETEDQLRAIAEVKADMESPQPMDRLICGDVGYGKTEVALRAAFKAVLDGKQVVMLAPTTVLAQQHHNTFRERLRPFPVNVEMLSRFRTAARQEAIIKMLREGGVDIVIGTHRLLSDDVAFQDLGLVIIDEEQRFGVSHKERLKQLRTEVDVLTMTATPIPRTLYMSLSGVRDISIIETAPSERMPVQTFVGESDDTLIRRAILRELDRGGQIFFVHNRVQTIEIVANLLRKLVPEAKIAVGHGQMSERELEEIMLRFNDGDIDLLLSTTIIESGLDIPNANTLIVHQAELFGLAQLYQLRGRVGRGVRQAHAYFFHSPWRSLTADAQARLEVIAHETQLGAGYSIAMRDLEIRGAGDLLGARQSGHIAAVGFDLYTRLLAQAVKARRAERAGEAPLPELPEATLIDLPLAAYIPPLYVPEASLRLRLYRRMAMLDSLAAIDEMAGELADRFGPIPDPVNNLLYQLRIKALAIPARVTAVTTEGGQIQIRLLEQLQLDRFRLQRYLGQSVRVSRKAIWMDRDLSTHEWQVALVQVLEKLHTFADSRATPTEKVGLVV